MLRFRSLSACAAAFALFLSGCSAEKHEDQAKQQERSSERMVAPVLTGEDARDPFSYARPQEARVTHVALDLAAEALRVEIGGTATLDVQAAPNAKEVVLDSKGLEIEAVTNAEGAPLQYAVGKADAERGAPLSVQLNGAKQIKIAYRSAPDAEALQWLTPEQTAGKQQPFLFSQGQPTLNRTWIPTQDSPGIRQTWEARITVPEPLKVVMSGENLARDGEPAGEGRRAFRFRMDKPVAPYLIAIAAGDLAFQELGPRSGVYAEPATIKAAAAELADTEKMIDAAEKLYGPERAAQEAALSFAEIDTVIEEKGRTSPLTRLHNPEAGTGGESGIVYDKGAAFLRTVEQIVGRERFDAWLRSYFARHAFQPMTSARFLADLRKHLIKGDQALEQKLKLDEWVYQPGLPDNAVRPNPQGFAQADAALRGFAAGGPAAAVPYGKWTTAERLRFLNGLPRELPTERLAELDQALRLSQSGNSETLFAWLQLALANRYEPAVPVAERFLLSMGRRKFVAPLFETLIAEGEWGRPIAERLYARARPTYHSVTTSAVDKALKGGG